jgi:hypothetical protein
MQVVKDLCLLANAEGFDSDKTVAMLQGVSSDLGLSQGFVTQALNAIVELE